jgi:hypothetical protein
MCEPHITEEQMTDLPKYDPNIQCPDCRWPNSIALTDLHGIFGGGGYGRYTMCENCGKVLSKSYDDDEERADVGNDKTG